MCWDDLQLACSAFVDLYHVPGIISTLQARVGACLHKVAMRASHAHINMAFERTRRSCVLPTLRSSGPVFVAVERTPLYHLQRTAALVDMPYMA